MLDAKLGNVIKEKLGINCLYSSGAWAPHGLRPAAALARVGCGARTPSSRPALSARRAASRPSRPPPCFSAASSRQGPWVSLHLCFVRTHPPTRALPLLPKHPHHAGVMELTRGIRNQLTALVAGLSAQDLRPMSLGLSHSLSRYKLKFSPDKVDTMIVQVGPAGRAGRGGRGHWGGVLGKLNVFHRQRPRCQHGQPLAAVLGARCMPGPRPFNCWARVCRLDRGEPCSSCLLPSMSPPRHHPPPPSSFRPSACWTTWTRSSTPTPCASASGTAGTSPR